MQKGGLVFDPFLIHKWIGLSICHINYTQNTHSLLKNEKIPYTFIKEGPEKVK